MLIYDVCVLFKLLFDIFYYYFYLQVVDEFSQVEVVDIGLVYFLGVDDSCLCEQFIDVECIMLILKDCFGICEQVKVLEVCGYQGVYVFEFFVFELV